MNGRRNDWALGLLACLLGAGCATTGPRVSSQEIRQETEELKAKQILRLAEEQQRVWDVGYRLLSALPEKDRHAAYPEVGMTVIRVTGAVRRAFGYPKAAKGYAVAAVRQGGPAAAAGIQRGDLLKLVDEKHASSLKKFEHLVWTLTPGQQVTVTVERAGAALPLPLTVGSLPRKIQFVVWNRADVNAWVNLGSATIKITSGMVRFLKSDDELAVVLGHELAHMTEAHRGKETATAVFASTLGAATGLATDLVVPGLGGVVSALTSSATQGVFSRDFEREADYKGLLHTYRAGYDAAAGVEVWERFGTELPLSMTKDLRSTHPSSAERLVRIRKIAESLKTIGLEATIARYETPGRQWQDAEPAAPAEAVAASVPAQTASTP